MTIAVPRTITAKGLGRINSNLATGVRHTQKWAESNLRIRTKKGKLVHIRYNSVQRALEAEFQKQFRERKPIRFLILKARQMGCSTWVESVTYDWMNHAAHQSALILADSPDSSERLYGMYTTFYDFHEDRLPTRYMRMRGLTFAPPHSSQIIVQTAAKKYPGTSLTIQCAHLSEVAKWPSPETVFLSLIQAVPNHADTFVAMESTAAGAGDWWNDQWNAAVRGESEWTPLFFPWFMMEEYSTPAQSINLEEFGTWDRYNLYEGEEKELMEQYQLSWDQMAWRRWCINNNCGGDVLSFNQEYPHSAESAFISSGTPRFSIPRLIEMRRQTKNPEWVGTFAFTDRLVYAPPKMIPGREGDVYIWKMPEEGHHYVIGADCAGSSMGGDYHAACVVDKSVYPHEVVCTIWGHHDADHYASLLANAGRLYHNAMLAIEVNGVGEAVQNACRHIYHNFYHRLPIDEEMRMPGRKIGWYTGHITRHNLIERLAAAIRDGDISVRDEDMVLELMAFHRVPGPRGAEAKPGTHDDRVFALGIALQALGYTTAGEFRHYNRDQHERAAGTNMAEQYPNPTQED